MFNEIEKKRLVYEGFMYTANLTLFSYLYRFQVYYKMGAVTYCSQLLFWQLTDGLVAAI